MWLLKRCYSSRGVHSFHYYQENRTAALQEGYARKIALQRIVAAIAAAAVASEQKERENEQEGERKQLIESIHG
jgi:hypothetical protein